MAHQLYGAPEVITITADTREELTKALPEPKAEPKKEEEH